MVQGFTPNPNNRPQIRITDAFQAQEKAESQEDANNLDHSIASIKDALLDMKEEIAGKVRVRNRDSGVSRSDAEEVNLHRTAQQQSDIESNESKFQQSTEFNTHDYKEESASRTAQQAAAFLNEEELDRLKKKQGKPSLMERLNILGKLEDNFKQFKFKDPEKQAIVNEFFENIERIKNREKRLRQLEHIEREHESKKPRKD